MSSRKVALGGDQIGRLAVALEDAYTLDQLRQLLMMGLPRGLSIQLDTVVPVDGRTVHDVCHDLVVWSLQDERVGLQGLLAAAVGLNPTNPQLRDLQKDWAGITFTAPACPYPGMKPFTTADQGRFYGRDAEIEQAVDRLRRF
ncbi:MAG: effector-associated domain EAD1-containing protein, partial [Caldilineaceae bacterium]